MQPIVLQDLPRAPAGVPVFAGLRFVTPWRRLDWLWMPPDERVPLPVGTPGSEQGLLLLAGTVEAVAEDAATRLSARLAMAPGWMAGHLGAAPQVSNPGSLPAQLLRLEIDAADGPCRRLAVGSFDAKTLQWRDAIHGGTGRLATRHVLPTRQFASTWTFLDHAILGPESSLGYHYHDALEECFVILRGHGYMTLAAQTVAMGPGMVTFQCIREPHGLYCPGPEPLEFIRVAVARPEEEYTTVDLHDDLRTRRPGPS